MSLKIIIVENTNIMPLMFDLTINLFKLFSNNNEKFIKIKCVSYFLQIMIKCSDK